MTACPVGFSLPTACHVLGLLHPVNSDIGHCQRDQSSGLRRSRRREGLSMRTCRTPRSLRCIPVIALSIALSLSACKRSTAPVIRPDNRSPAIQSLLAFPGRIGPGDSIIVVCEAFDADADTLVYDWFSDSRLVIKGNAPADHDLYEQRSNSHVFYYGWVSPSDTSAWVQCIVRDHKGGGVGRIVNIALDH